MTAAALALALALGQAAADPSAALRAANGLYLSGDFEGAARAYEALVDLGFTGFALQYNLGNAHLRAGRVGWAVASYERALRLRPGDADALANLDLARRAGVDRLVGAQEEPLAERVLARVSDEAATVSFGAAWACLWILLLVRRAARAARRPWLSAGAAAMALAAMATGLLLAGKARGERTPDAVVVAPVTPVREGASATLRVAFELHEGTKVRVVGADAGFLRIRLANGLEGWVASDAVTVI